MKPLSKDDLYGSWELERWRLITADGTDSYPFTEQAQGRIIYGPGDRMCVLLMHPDWQQGRERGFSAYGGGFKIEGQAVHHLIDMASDPDLIGSDQKRHVTLEELSLRLESPATDNSGARHIVEWRRVG